MCVCVCVERESVREGEGKVREGGRESERDRASSTYFYLDLLSDTRAFQPVPLKWSLRSCR